MVDECYLRASDVDHITPRSFGGSDDERNLQALCSTHHKRKTALQSSGWGQGGQNR
jgi:5-methylcytosine-specific restriction protein A